MAEESPSKAPGASIDSSLAPPSVDNRPRLQMDDSEEEISIVDPSPGPSEATTPRQGARKHAVGDSIASMVLSDHGYEKYSYSLPFPSPQAPSRCPLFSCFYAEFDDKVGPKVSFQSPPNFLSQNIHVSVTQIEATLQETLDALQENPPAMPIECHPDETLTPDVSSSSLPGDDSHLSSLLTIQQGLLDDTEHSSIFDSCSQYIITGRHLSGKIVNLSTHNLHVLTRPTVLTSERYRRNTLTFCVGFVLRRTSDPRPFRPILTRLANVWTAMETESQFLSNNHNRTQQMQATLEWILAGLNSLSMEVHLALDPSNQLHLKLFGPPTRPAPPVPDFAIPIFLPVTTTVEWDLAINWVSLYIDGKTTAAQIARKADVDLAMVRACLRVLRHHQVLAVHDLFSFHNRYESVGCLWNRPKLWMQAVNYVLRSPKPLPNVTPAKARHSAEVLTQAKVAVAELYGLMNRNETLQDLWLSLIKGDTQRGSTRSVSWKKVQLTYVMFHRTHSSFRLCF